MPEYVYALHDFTPENEDEVPFRAGEQIEVLEKDDEYGDGWWQVCLYAFRKLSRPSPATMLPEPSFVYFLRFIATMSARY